ncbi:MAG: hypothetical protein ACRDZ4_04850 [Egibacteraceae bacterium]
MRNDTSYAMGISVAPKNKRTVVKCAGDDLVTSTPCCQQEVHVGGSHFSMGATVLCVGCAGQYHVEFVGIRGIDVCAVWSWT